MGRNIDTVGIGKRLKFEREKLGITQEEMAERLGVSDRQYRRYENGTSQMRSNALFILNNMGVPLDYLCNGQVALDWWVERSFKIMPNDMLEEKVQQLMDIAKRHEADGDQNELVDFLLELRKYAMMHNDDKVLRKVDTFTYFTEAYERFGLKCISTLEG